MVMIAAHLRGFQVKFLEARDAKQMAERKLDPRVVRQCFADVPVILKDEKM